MELHQILKLVCSEADGVTRQPEEWEKMLQPPDTWTRGSYPQCTGLYKPNNKVVNGTNQKMDT